MKKAISDSIKPDAIDPLAWQSGKWLLDGESPELYGPVTVDYQVHTIAKSLIIAIVDQQIRIMMRAGK